MVWGLTGVEDEGLEKEDDRSLAKNKAFHMIIFVILHRQQNILVFGKTLQTRLYCEYVNVKILVKFF
jgi:hypothetical protein